MIKRIILELSIVENEGKQEFLLHDKFNELTLGEMSAAVGMLSSLLHNYWHIHAEEHNKLILKNKSKN